jgi:ABC-type multidrug transport system fused ATPase/permease subunit
VTDSAHPSGDASVRTTLQEFRDIAKRLGVRPWPPPLIVGLGLVTAALEALAIALVVTMLFALLGQPIEGGPVGAIVNSISDLSNGDWSALAIAVLLLVAVKAGVAQLYTLLSIRYKNDVNARLMAAAHAQLVDMPYASLRAKGQGELINTTATDAWQLANAAYLLTRVAINLSVILIFSLFIIALSWQIALMAAAGGVAIALAGHLIARVARAHGVRVRADIEAIYTRLLAAVHGARIIRAFAQEQAEKRRAADAAARLRRDTVRAEATRALAGPLNEIGYLALLAQASTFTAIALLYRLAPQIREMEGNRLLFASLYAPLRAVGELLRSSPGCGEAGEELDGPIEAIRFEAVTFQPPGAAEPILSNVSFEIPAGRVTALLGPSGAGKTSIVNLLLRLYAPDEGAIWVGSRPLERIKRISWLARVAAAGQDLDVIEGTIAENLRLGAPGATEAELRDAARAAHALSFIEQLPDGFDTWVGSFGYNLSGGQRQRLSLARALLRKPKLLILDESTSAVESAVEAEILKTMIEARQEMTIVLITHRLNRAAQVDHVVRLEHGAVVAEGPWAPAQYAQVPGSERRA